MAISSISSNNSSKTKIKFHYGYGGTITPCRNGGNLRYAGGTNGILQVDRNITYTELIIKLWDVCGPSMSLRCKLPDDDLDTLVQVRSDEDLANVLEEYDRCAGDLKIRIILDEKLKICLGNKQFQPKDLFMHVIHQVYSSNMSCL